MRRIWFILILIGGMAHSSDCLSQKYLGAEEKYDEYMEDYLSGLKLFMKESSPEKSLEILRALAVEFKERAEQLKPELEQWLKAVPDDKRAELSRKLFRKPYMKEIFQLKEAEDFQKKISKSPGIKKAYEELVRVAALVRPEL